MAYSVTAQQIYNDICYSLLETADSGAAEPTSGLYTRAEIIARINYRMYEFNKRTGVYVADNKTQAADNTVNRQALTVSPNPIDILQLSYDTSGASAYQVIPRGSSFEANLFIDDERTAVSVPTIWAIDDAPPGELNLLPKPTGTNNMRLYYVAMPTALTSPPDTTVLTLPDDFTPFIKFGVLADLFGKSGETYDPQRQAICEQMFELGVETARSWVSGSQV